MSYSHPFSFPVAIVKDKKEPKKSSAPKKKSKKKVVRRVTIGNYNEFY